jgi:cytochrome c5
MRRHPRVTLVLVAALALGAALVAPADAQQPPADFTPKTKAGNGKTEVKGKKVFSVDGGDKCATCHKKP